MFALHGDQRQSCCSINSPRRHVVLWRTATKREESPCQDRVLQRLLFRKNLQPDIPKPRTAIFLVRKDGLEYITYLPDDSLFLLDRR